MSVQLIDFVDNCAHLSSEQINDILLNKEKFWVGMLLTMHKGMNSSHDWSRKNRIGGEISAARDFSYNICCYFQLFWVFVCVCFITKLFPLFARLSICSPLPHSRVLLIILSQPIFPCHSCFQFPFSRQKLEMPRLRDISLIRMFDLAR